MTWYLQSARGQGRKRKERGSNNVTGSVKVAGNYLIAQVKTGDRNRTG